MASMRMGWACLMIAASCCLAACGLSAGTGLGNIQSGNSQSQHVWRAPDDHIDVPFAWHDGHLIIPVRVNGSVQVRLAFDTGASATVLFETERTRSLALHADGEIRVGGGEGRAGTPVSIVTAGCAVSTSVLTASTTCWSTSTARTSRTSAAASD